MCGKINKYCGLLSQYQINLLNFANMYNICSIEYILYIKYNKAHFLVVTDEFVLLIEKTGGRILKITVKSYEMTTLYGMMESEIF